MSITLPDSIDFRTNAALCHDVEVRIGDHVHTKRTPVSRNPLCIYVEGDLTGDLATGNYSYIWRRYKPGERVSLRCTGGAMTGSVVSIQIM